MTEQATWDLHAHFTPPSFVAEMRAGTALDGIRSEVVDGEEWLVHGDGSIRTALEEGLHDVPARLRDMDERGIDVSVISLQPNLYMYGVGAADARTFARMVNDDIAQAVDAGGGRLLGLAHLPMQDPEAAVEEARRAHDDLGLVGCQVGPLVGDQTLDVPDFAELLGTLERLGMPMTLHPYLVGAKERAGLDKYHMSNLIGHPYQTCLGASRIIMGGVFDRLPGLEVVLMHGGGFFPYQVGRLDHGQEVRPEATGCEERPSSYLRRFTFDTLTHSPASLQFLVGVVGADRVAYGTDYPFDMGGGPVAEQLADVRLTDRERALISGGTAQHLYARSR